MEMEFVLTQSADLIGSMDTQTCIHVNLTTMKNKDVGIRIRVENELRDAFQDACSTENRCASDVLREFMRSFSEQHNSKQGRLFAAPVNNIHKTSKKKI